MKREEIIKRTISTLTKLPDDKVNEVADYADFILRRYDDEILQQGIHKIVSDSKSFDFLKDEEDLYSLNDLKERYK